jgi:hypothetical protein
MTRLLILLLYCLPSLAMADATHLGRLFLTPAERTALDIVRLNNKPPEKIIKAGEKSENEQDDTAEAPSPPPVVSVHGYVKRSDGKGTVWVNGQPVQEKVATKDIEVGRLRGNTNQVQIKLPATGQTINLKAGQSYDPASGKVVDSYRDLPTEAIPGKETLKPVAKKGEVAGKEKPIDKAPETSAPRPPAPATVAPASAR